MGSYEESLRSVSLNADDTLAKYTGPPGAPGSLVPNSGFIYRAVTVTGKDLVGLATHDTDVVVGFLQNKPQVENMAATIAISGITNAIAGENDLTAGTVVGVDGEGRVVAASPDQQVVGVVLHDSSVIGEVVPVLIRSGYAA